MCLSEVIIPLKIYLVLIFGQIFAIFPACGITQSDASKLSYKFTSLRSLYTMLILFFYAIEFFTLTYIIYTTGVDFSLAGDLLFYFLATFTTIYMKINARGFIALLKLFTDYEEVFTNPPYAIQSQLKAFTRKAKYFSVFFFSLFISKIW
jgi:hypothetical protein